VCVCVCVCVCVLAGGVTDLQGQVADWMMNEGVKPQRNPNASVCSSRTVNDSTRLFVVGILSPAAAASPGSRVAALNTTPLCKRGVARFLEAASVGAASELKFSSLNRSPTYSPAAALDLSYVCQACARTTST
jgi:hypothetical protein